MTGESGLLGESVPVSGGQSHAFGSTHALNLDSSHPNEAARNGAALLSPSAMTDMSTVHLQYPISGDPERISGQRNKRHSRNHDSDFLSLHLQM